MGGEATRSRPAGRRELHPGRRAVAARGRAVQRCWLCVRYGDLAELYAETGDLNGAERAMALLAAVRAEAYSWRGQQPEWIAGGGRAAGGGRGGESGGGGC